MCTRKNIEIMYSNKLLHFCESKYMNIVMRFLPPPNIRKYFMYSTKYENTLICCLVQFSEKVWSMEDWGTSNTYSSYGSLTYHPPSQPGRFKQYIDNNSKISNTWSMSMITNWSPMIMKLYIRYIKILPYKENANQINAKWIISWQKEMFLCVLNKKKWTNVICFM